ncbi:transposase, partial [Escherichia coli]|uniref:transposase n=1 Tax=Escherichia coli TaxID=562 RepID=UPI00207BD423
MQKNVTPGRRKGCPNYPPEFKQQLVAASCEPGISISKLALENGINANLLFKWRQQWREGKLLLPSSESPTPPQCNTLITWRSHVSGSIPLSLQ